MLHILAAWVIMLTVYWTYRSAGYQSNEFRQDAEAIDRMAGPDPIYSLPKTVPWLNTVYYANRTMTETEPEKIIALAKQWKGPVYAMARDAGNPADWEKADTTLHQIAAASGRHLQQVKVFLPDGLAGVQKLFRLINRRQTVNSKRSAVPLLKLPATCG